MFQCQYISTVRETRELSSKDALSQLHEINNTLASLLDHVTAFTSWWSSIVTLLVTVKSGVAQLDSSKLEKSRMTLIQERWADIANQYRTYAREVSEDN
jgi:hypothetical protein